MLLGELLLEWEGLQARIIRPDVQAVNGVIHVIDRVMMKRRDLTKSGSPIGQQSPAYLPVILAFALAAIFFWRPNKTQHTQKTLNKEHTTKWNKNALEFPRIHSGSANYLLLNVCLTPTQSATAANYVFKKLMEDTNVWKIGASWIKCVCYGAI